MTAPLPPEADTADDGLPPRPVRPEPGECCKGNCTPCIFEVYEDALDRWEREVAEILRKRGEDPSRKHP